MIVIYYSDNEEGQYETLEEAKEGILDRFNETWSLSCGPIVPERIFEISVNGDETGKEYRCFWTCNLEEF